MTKNYSNLVTLLDKYNLVLASSSPRRVSLLSEAGFTFRQIIPDIDEKNHQSLSPYELTVQLAEQKAAAVLSQANDNDIILGSDTIVVLNDEILNKPKSTDDAYGMLTKLAGQKHTVCSAAALYLPDGNYVSGYELTDVYFRHVSANSIKEYIATGEPLDKAGAYGIQGRGGFLVDRFEGNLDNVIGLPMTLVNELAGKLLAGI